MRPGVNVTTRENAPPSAPPTDVATGFMVGITESGPTTPTADQLIRNMDEYDTVYAPTGRAYAQGAVMRDSAEVFFNEGGSRLYVARLLGAAAVSAAGALKDNAAATVLTATAKSGGEWGNSMNVKVVLPADNPDIGANLFRIQILRGTTLLEESPDLADPSAAINWSTSSGYVVLSGGVSSLALVSQTVALTGGTSDLASITNPTWKNAASSFSIALGPGILMAPGATTDQIHADLASVANTTGRVAFCDGPNTGSAASLIASAKAIIDSNTNKRARFSAMFAPWLIIPGLTSGTIRVIPPSAAVAGIFSRNMAIGRSANEPAAGDQGIFRSVQGMSYSYSDADRQSMNNNGVCVCRDVYGTFKVYGWRTNADPVSDKRWINLGNSLLHRQIIALANAVGERFIFRQIDGQGHLIGEFNGALVGGVCMPLYLAGALSGQTPDDAYRVDTSSSVNTPATIANNELHAVISVVMSPFAEEVDIQIVKYLVTETIPA